MAPQGSENSSADASGYLGVPPADSTNTTDATLASALATLRKRKYIIIALAVLGYIYGFYTGSTQPKLYESSGRIEIRSGSANQFRVGVTGDSNTGGRIATEAAIIHSNTLLFTVALDLDLANNPDFLGISHRPPRANTDDPAVRQQLIGMLAGMVTVSQVPKTDLILITCRTHSAKLSADIINKLIDEYITRSFKSRVYSTQRASEWLTSQLDDLKRQVQTSQEQVIDLQKRLGVLALDPGHSELTSSLENLTTAAQSAEIKRIEAESRYRVLLGMDPLFLDQNIANTRDNVAATRMQALRTQHDQIVTDLAKAGAPGGIGPNNPQAKAMRAQLDQITSQINEEESRTIAQAKGNFVDAQANENQTRAVLEAEKNAAYKLRDDFVDYIVRQRELDSERTLYEGLVTRLRTAGVEAGLESTEIDIIDQAMPPPGPSMEPRSTFVIVDTAVATVLGIILAFMLESLDNGLRSVAEIEAVTGLPSLALIPRSRRTGVDVSTLSIAQRNVGALSSPKSQFTEAFRALRTSLLLSKAGSLPNVILLTSATPSEGKTTIATNLACVLAQNNVRVLMIDGDLRRPTVHHRLGLNGKIGLTSILTGTATLAEAVQRLPELPNLEILVSGPVPPFPTEMLGSATMVKLLEEARGIYTHIVIDSPPLLSVTDGVVLARDADTVVLIVRHGKSGKQTVRRARDLLVRAGAPVTGIAINAVDLSSPEYYGYYGYSVYAGYGSAGVEPSSWESKYGAGAGKGDQE